MAAVREEVAWPQRFSLPGAYLGDGRVVVDKSLWIYPDRLLLVLIKGHSKRSIALTHTHRRVPMVEATWCTLATSIFMPKAGVVLRQGQATAVAIVGWFGMERLRWALTAAGYEMQVEHRRLSVGSSLAVGIPPEPVPFSEPPPARA